ncbi:MAG: YfcE family phosphodiesterase [Clostridia bacterium]|nr:YfcE family phosphodiesterase [Clostridia bacterium]
MKCLCFSDSHGTSRGIRRALSLHRDAEVVFFLGDGLLDIMPLVSEYTKLAWIFVRGNCDTFREVDNREAKITDTITLVGKKIVLTHGDRYGAKSGYGELISLAKRSCADIVLFGHTHQPYEKFYSEDEVYLFNPGSIGEGYLSLKSYGVINLTESGVLLSHGFLT